jgi:predicted cobalt transporter CbtA
MRTHPVTSHDRRPQAAVTLAVLALATALTFFWLYGLPPLLFAIPAAVLARRLIRERGGITTMTAVATGLTTIAIICDIAFLVVNRHHLY